MAISLAWLDTALIKSCRHFSTFLSNFSQSWSQKPPKFIFTHIFWGKNTNPKIPSDQKNPEPYQQQVNEIATFFVTIKFTQYKALSTHHCQEWSPLKKSLLDTVLRLWRPKYLLLFSSFKSQQAVGQQCFLHKSFYLLLLQFPKLKSFILKPGKLLHPSKCATIDLITRCIYNSYSPRCQIMHLPTSPITQINLMGLMVCNAGGDIGFGELWSSTPP